MIFFLVISTSFLICASAFAYRDSERGMTAELGVGGIVHYDLSVQSKTPPSSILVIGEMDYWFNRWVDMYGLFGFAVNGSSAKLVGVGGKLAFLHADIGGMLHMMFAADALYIHYRDRKVGELYEQSGVMPRFGGAIRYDIKGTQSFVNAAMLLSVYSENIMINPYLGFGLRL